MARYVGGSVAVAAVGDGLQRGRSTTHREPARRRRTRSPPGSARVFAGDGDLRRAGVALALLMGRHRGEKPTAVSRAAAAAVTAHTIPTRPTSS